MHNVVGRGTYTTIHGEVRQMYQCNVCEKAFSETAGTPLVSVTTKIIYGSKDVIQAFLEPLGQKINTAFVERVNLTMRHLVSRLHCKTLCFSKKREYLVYHLHLALAYYHFARHHASLRVALPEPLPTRGNGSPKKWQQRTPAMAAGLTDHRWSLRELLMCSVSAAPG